MTPRLIVLYLIIFTISVIVLFIFFYKREDKKDFIKFGKKIFIYSLPIIVIVLSYYIAEKPYRTKLNGISSADQLIQSFKNSISLKKSLYIFGNSRCYRGINPDSLGKSVFNFAYDNETFLEQYFKLEYMQKNGIVPDTIILGVDYFEFSFVSTFMEETYKAYFSDEYLNSINQMRTNKVLFNKSQDVNEYVNTTMSNLFGRCAGQYFCNLYRTKILNSDNNIPYLKDNGQYIINPVPKARRGDFVKRDTTIMNIQKEYFEKIITFSIQNNVILYLVMLPTRNIERKSYSNYFINKMDSYFISKCKSHQVLYISYYKKDYPLGFFMDDTHLNPTGADKFSVELAKDMQRVSQNPDSYLYIK